MWLRLGKDRDSDTYCVPNDTGALAMAFGRDLEFSRTELADPALGAMLIDIGRLKLPPGVNPRTGERTVANTTW